MSIVKKQQKRHTMSNPSDHFSMNKKIPCLLFVLLLTACNQGEQIPELPSEEVLQNAARATQELASAQFNANGTFDLKVENAWNLSGKGSMEGVLNNGGDQVQFSVSIEGVSTNQDEPFSFMGSADVIVGGPQEYYLKLNSVAAEPMNMFMQPGILSLVLNKWWILPQEEGAETAAPLTPDPRLLHAQAEVVTVTESHGIEKIGERNVYHYTTTVDPEKLADYLEVVSEERGEEFDRDEIFEIVNEGSASGEIWIDAETFFVHKLKWKIKPIVLADSTQEISGEFTVNLWNHNQALEIQLPNDAMLFSPENFVPTIPSIEEADDILQHLEGLEGVPDQPVLDEDILDYLLYGE